MADKIKLSIDGNEAQYPLWATEETLQQVATQLGAKRSGISTLDVSSKKAAKEVEKLGKGAKAIQSALTETASAAGSVAQSLFNTDGSLNSLLPAVEAVVLGFNKVTNAFLSIGSGIPIISGFVKALEVGTDLVAEVAVATFDLVTSIADSIADGFRDIAQVGATLEGNFKEMTKLSFGANIGLEDLGALLEQAGPSLSAFSTSSEGARRVLGALGKLHTKELLPTFTRLGYTIQELNETGIDYMNILATTGQTTLLRTGNEQALADATGKYAVNLSVLSRLTGQNRKELQAQMVEESKRANVQALLALKEQDMSAEELEAFRNMQIGLKKFSPVLAEAFASISTIGEAVGDGHAAILAQLGPAGDELKKFALAFKDGTANVGDADVTGVLDAVAKGLTDENTLQMALLAPAGGFPAALAEVVGEGLAFAQKFIAGDVSLAEIREQVDKEREGRIEAADQNRELVYSIIDAQTNVATLSISLQEMVLQSQSTMDIIGLTTDAITNVTELLEKFITSNEGGEIEGSKNVAISTPDGTVYVTAKEAIIMEKEGKGTTVTTSQGSLGETIPQVPAEHAKAWEDKVRAAVQAFTDAGEPIAGKTLWSEYMAQRIHNKQDLNAFIDKLNKEYDTKVQHFQKGTKGIIDFGAGALAMLHGKEAVIPAPEGTIPVDLGDSLSPLVAEFGGIIKQAMGGGNNLLAQDGVNSVQSKEIVLKLDEMISVLKYMAGGDPKVAQLGIDMKRLASKMTLGVDLYRI